MSKKNTKQKKVSTKQVETPQQTSEQTPNLQEDLAQELEQAQQSAKDNWDQLLRTKAEMENLTRRNRRDLENAHKYALERFVKELLSVKDSLTMSLQEVNKEDINITNIKKGVEMIDKTFADVLENFNVKDINPINEPFNPEYHEAMTMVAMPDKKSQSVVEVIQIGITLNDRLIRPARVIVAK